MSFTWLPPPILVAGPCALEDDRLNLTVATVLAELHTKLGLRVLFKGSFDKANRSDINAARGPGLDEGLRQLEKVRTETGLCVITDVHEASQVEVVSQVVDAIQIPAFLCRQTDLLVAAGRAGKPVNIKKGQWMEAGQMAGAVAKVKSTSNAEVAITERGTFFGYGDLVVDMRNFARLKRSTQCPILFDATHAVQQPGRGTNGASGGTRADVPALLLGAAASGADGFFLETHPQPESAPSDSATMWPLDRLEELVARTMDVWEVVVGQGRQAESGAEALGVGTVNA